MNLSLVHSYPLKQSLPTQLPSLGDIEKAIGYKLHQLKVSFKQIMGDHVLDHSAAHEKVISDLHDVYDLASVGYILDDRIREKMVNVWSMIMRNSMSMRMSMRMSISREKMKGRYNRTCRCWRQTPTWEREQKCD